MKPQPGAICRWVGIRNTECGQPAVAVVKVRTRITTAYTDLCTEHKTQHDEQAAKIRVEQQQQAG